MIDSFCPSGGRAIGLSRGVPICAECKRIEDYLEKIELIHFFRKTEEEKAATLTRYAEDAWAARCLELVPALPSIVENGDGYLTVQGAYGIYKLPLEKQHEQSNFDDAGRLDGAI